MADEESQYSDYSDEDAASEDPLATYYPSSHQNDFFRPTLADEQKIGFFSLDRATQTEQSEIIDLKEMTEVIQQLLEEAATMKRDIHFARNVMQADFESKLQQKAIDLYCRVNEKITDIEKMHEDRVSTVRRAFKQQLSDAISRMHTYYSKSTEGVVPKDRPRKVDNSKQEAKFREMQATIQRNESTIHMMQQQLSEFQKQAEENERSRRSRSPGTVKEIEDLKSQVTTLEDRVNLLEESSDIKDENIQELNKDITDLTDQLEKEKILIAQLRNERDELIDASKQDRMSSQRFMEKQKLLMEKEMQEKLQKAKEEALSDAQAQAASLQAAEREKLNKVLEEKKKAELALQKEAEEQERAKQERKNQDALELEIARKNEMTMRGEITRLKKEIEKVHKTWEKKFAILQHSLHALKDESYLRQTMQKQATQLHQASITYATDGPLGIAPASRGPSSAMSKNKPLPDISRGKSPAMDCISYTISAPPSGRNTALTMQDAKPKIGIPQVIFENQVMSDNEGDLPEGFMSLPSPPPPRSQSHSATDCAAEQERSESRRSTRSQHIVVLPSC